MCNLSFGSNVLSIKRKQKKAARSIKFGKRYNNTQTHKMINAKRFHYILRSFIRWDFQSSPVYKPNGLDGFFYMLFFFTAIERILLAFFPHIICCRFTLIHDTHVILFQIYGIFEAVIVFNTLYVSVEPSNRRYEQEHALNV